MKVFFFGCHTAPNMAFCLIDLQHSPYGLRQFRVDLLHPVCDVFMYGGFADAKFLRRFPHRGVGVDHKLCYCHRAFFNIAFQTKALPWDILDYLYADRAQDMNACFFHRKTIGFVTFSHRFFLIKWSFPWFFRKKPHFSHQKTIIFDRKIFSVLVFFHNNSLFFPVESDVFIRIKPFFMRISWEIINFMIIILLIYSFYLYKMNKSSYHCRGGLFQAAWNLTSLTLLW